MTRPWHAEAILAKENTASSSCLNFRSLNLIGLDGPVCYFPLKDPLNDTHWPQQHVEGERYTATLHQLVVNAENGQSPASGIVRHAVIDPCRDLARFTKILIQVGGQDVATPM